MTQPSEVKIRLYGAFREFTTEGSVRLSLEGGETARELKELLGHTLAALAKKNVDVAALVTKSVLATDADILSESDPITQGELSILPPVCGG